jgi:hypothetical protein
VKHDNMFSLARISPMKTHWSCHSIFHRLLNLQLSIWIFKTNRWDYLNCVTTSISFNDYIYLFRISIEIMNVTSSFLFMRLSCQANKGNNYSSVSSLMTVEVRNSQGWHIHTRYQHCLVSSYRWHDNVPNVTHKQEYLSKFHRSMPIASQCVHCLLLFWKRMTN